MDFKLKVKKKADTTFSVIDLFPDTIVDFSLDFYNVDNIDQLRVPTSVSLNLPLTDTNVSVIDYDPRGNTYTTLPTTAFDFDLEMNGSSVLKGNLYVESYEFNNTIPVLNVRLVDKIQEIFSIAKQKTFPQVYDDLSSLTSFQQYLGANQETIGTSPTMDDLMFPYVDFCNDTQKFGYAARQFIQFGFNKDRTGFVPALQVKSFVDRFFTEAGSSVTSRFFELGNYGTGITGNNADDLYMLMPSSLKASSRTRTRGFILIEGPYEYFLNDFTGDANIDITSALERDTFPKQTYGWNYNGTPSSNPVDTDYGLNYTTNLPNDGLNIDRAYFGSHMSYTANPLSTSQDIGSGWIAFEIPMIKTSGGVYNMVSDITPSTSDAVINFNAVLWKDGSPSERFRMCNTDGSIKNINVSSASVHEMQTPYSEFWGVYDHVNGYRTKDYINYTDPQNATVLNNQLRFDTNDIGDFIWEQKDIDVDAGSIYAVTIEVEWVSGDIDLQYVDTWQPYFNMVSMADDGVIPQTYATRSISNTELVKGVYREDPNNVGYLYTAFSSSGDHNPYFLDDDVNVAWLFDDIDLTPFDVMKQVMSRFNLSAVYDQNTDSVLIDRLPDIRSQNTQEDITDKVDDAPPMKVDVVTKLARSVEIETNKNDLFYDTYGYNKVDVNPAGSDDLKFSLESRFYNQSLCGDETFIEIPEGFNEYEIGFTMNQFTKHTDIGIVFGYIDTPSYKTNVKRARFVNKNGYKGLVYETLLGHVFPRFVKDKANSFPLYYFDTQDQPTDLYNFFSGNDNIVYYNKSKVKFSALFNEDYVFNVKDNYAEISMSYLPQGNLIIKSFEGKIYDGGIYGDIEAIIL